MREARTAVIGHDSLPNSQLAIHFWMMMRSCISSGVPVFQATEVAKAYSNRCPCRCWDRCRRSAAPSSVQYSSRSPRRPTARTTGGYLVVEILGRTAAHVEAEDGLGLGLVFTGYVAGIPCAVLKGGRYDYLMQRFTPGANAIGFAIYLDELERLAAPLPPCSSRAARKAG